MRLPPARATIALVIVTACAWGLVAAAGLEGEVAVRAGFVPLRWSGRGLDVPGAVPGWLMPLTTLFVHGGLIHLAFNLLMLGFCGRFVEPALGARGILILYGVGAYAAAAAQWLVTPLAAMPMIGASGAISAVVAAYALLFGEQRTGLIRSVKVARTVHVLWLAAAWIGLQLLIGLVTIGSDRPIAVIAHIGGFLAGLVLARPLLRWGFDSRVAGLR